ncbi:MAG: chloride channel protein [Candidatus Omnitrophica bacterium]|nr:chloride channel protein [Candidatus Omnitrophota bacterium]
MKRRIAEGTILLLDIVKWVVVATTVGAVVGLSSAVFLKTLFISSQTVHGIQLYYVFLPAAFFLSTLMISKLAPEAEGHGTEKVVEAIHRRFGKINIATVPVKLAATVVTIAFGGSAGKEGPCAQIGAGLASGMADLFRFNKHDRRKIVICGISAGFAAVFGTPIAGAIFGVEVVFIGAMLYDVLLPSIIAGTIGYQVAATLGMEYMYTPVRGIPVFAPSLFFQVLLAGVFFGIVSFVFIEVLNFAKNLSSKIKMRKHIKALFGGFVLAILAVLFSVKYLGLGVDTLDSALAGGACSWYDPVLKMIFTSVTLEFGGSGGIVTPIFFIGSTAGSFFAGLIGQDGSMFAVLGLVSLLSGAANTPIAAIIMAVELFGPEIAPYAALSCALSFIMTGHRSVFPSQVLSIRKASSIHTALGTEMSNIRTMPRLPRIIRILRVLISRKRNTFSRNRSGRQE